MRKLFLIYFLAFSLFQGLLHDGKEALTLSNFDDLLSFKQALSSGDSLSIPRPTTRFSRDIADSLGTPVLRPPFETALLVSRSVAFQDHRRQGNPQTTGINFQPWEWGFTAPLFPRGDG